MKKLFQTVRNSSPFNRLERSLLRRIVAGQLIFIALFCLVISANLFWQFEKNGDGENDTALYAAAKAISQSIEANTQALELSVQMNELVHFLSVLGQYTNEELRDKVRPTLFALRAFNQQGKETFRSKQFSGALLNAPLTKAHTVLVDQREWRVVSYTSPSKMTTLQFAETTQSFDEGQWPIVEKYVLKPLLWFLPLSALATFWIALNSLKPLTQLANVIATRKANDLSPLNEGTSYAETRPILSEINSLLVRLNATLKRERKFLADAAHELRTPLAIIQIQTDVLINARNQSERIDATNELRIGIERATGLLKRLLMIAKIDLENSKPKFEAVEISSFVQDRVAFLAPLAMQKTIDLKLTVSGPYICHIDRDSFTSAFDNVLDNAIRYTPEGGQIQVTTQHLASTAVELIVADSGSGIAQEYLPLVFDRFFRVPGTEPYGSGLGLAIVHQVMLLHRGEVLLSTGLDSKGLSVTLKLPHIT
jgi:signal transduction histidine kinase